MGFFSALFGSKKYTNINNEELQRITKLNKNALILDVRSPGEFRNNHIPKAKNIPVQELSTKLESLSEYKDDEIIVYCASGGRSASAANILYKSGFNNIYNLGGIGNYKGKLK
ncbi:MAG: rhodanese-like domain-containing protein [Paraclostridium sp.]